MANQYRRTIVLGLDYSEFSGGITECNRKIGLLDAEFKRASEEAKLYGTEADQLRIKQEYLSQKIELQKKIVEESEKAYRRAIETNGEGSRAAEIAERALINQNTALLRLEGQMNETSEATEETTEQTETFGDSIRGITNFLGLEASPALESFASHFDGVNKGVGEAIVVIGALATAYAGLAIDLSHTADDLLTLSSISGLSTDTLQELQYASEFVDVSVDTMNGSMTKLIKNMGSARDGNKELQKEFAQLGVKYKEHNKELRNAEEVFYDTIDALGKISNETERDAKAMDIFGKSAKDLNPLIEAGSKRLRELADEAHEAGYVLSNETLQSAGALDDEMQQMNRKIEAVKLQLGTYLVPILTNLIDILGKIPTPVLVGIAVFGTLLAVLGSVAKAATMMAMAQATAAAANMTLGASGQAAVAGMAPLLAILLAIAAVIALIVGGTMAVNKAMNEAKNSANDVINSAQKYQTKPKYNAAGTEYYEGGETWVGEHGPERVVLPRGSRIYSSEESVKSGNVYNVYNVTIPARDVKEWNAVVKMVQQQKTAERTGRVSV